MPDDVNTSESPALDAEDWRIALEVYKGHPVSALTLAYHLTALKECVQSDVVTATEAIERAVDALYEQSDFRQVSHALFRATVEGKLPTDKEHILRLLGINT